jgi:hypothetical protein
VGRVFSTQSRADQATVFDAPAGRIVAASSHSSARWAASRTAVLESPPVPEEEKPILASPLPLRFCSAICLARS